MGNIFLKEGQKIKKFKKKQFYQLLLTGKLEFERYYVSSIKVSKKQLQRVEDLPKEYITYHDIQDQKRIGRDVEFQTQRANVKLYLYHPHWKSDCLSYGNSILIQNRHKVSGENRAFIFHIK